MKNTLILILIFIASMILFSEEVIVETPYKDEITLDLPESYDELRELTIQIAELYWGERYDLESTLKTLAETRASLNEILIERNIALSENQLIKAEINNIKKLANKRTFIAPSILGGVSFSTRSNTSFYFGAQLILLETVLMQASFDTDLSINLGLGLQF